MRISCSLSLIWKAVIFPKPRIKINLLILDNDYLLELSTPGSPHALPMTELLALWRTVLLFDEWAISNWDWIRRRRNQSVCLPWKTVQQYRRWRFRLWIWRNRRSGTTEHQLLHLTKLIKNLKLSTPSRNSVNSPKMVYSCSENPILIAFWSMVQEIFHWNSVPANVRLS